MDNIIDKHGGDRDNIIFFVILYICMCTMYLFKYMYLYIVNFYVADSMRLCIMNYA